MRDGLAKKYVFTDDNRETESFDFISEVKVSNQREPMPYIYGLGARFGCERVSEHSNRRD